MLEDLGLQVPVLWLNNSSDWVYDRVMPDETSTCLSLHTSPGMCGAGTRTAQAVKRREKAATSPGTRALTQR